MSFLLLGLALALAAHLLAASVLSALVAGCLPALEPRVVRLPPRARAAVWLGLGLLPAAGGFAAVFGVVVPAWIVREPWRSGEKGGLVLWALAAAGAALVVTRVAGGVAVLVRTRRMAAGWARGGSPVEGLPLPALRFEHELPVALLAGLRRPRLLLANRLVAALDREALCAVAAHELGHVAACDNLKRLLLASSPDPLALTSAGERIRRRFEEASEGAADGVACGHVSAVRLARTLVDVAQLFPPGRRLELSLASFTGEQPLAARVRTLLARDASPSGPTLRFPIRKAAAVVVAIGLLALGAAAVLRPEPHAAIETLVRLLT